MQSPFKTIKKKRKRMSKRLKRFLHKNNFDAIYNALKSSSDANNYYDFSRTHAGKISYLKPARLPALTNKIYDCNHRIGYGYHAKISKLMDNPASMNNDLIKFSERIFERQSKFEVLLLDNICYQYMNSAGGGLLENSCMRHENLQDAIAFYERLGSDKVQLAVILREGKVIARALYWHQVQTSTGAVKYLDRVYAVDTLIESWFYRWAELQNIKSFRTGLGCGGKIFVSGSSTSDPMPYMDTFSACDDCLSYVSNRCDDVELASVDGASVDDLAQGSYRCDACEDSICEDDAHYSDMSGETYCDSCCHWCEYENGYLFCDHTRYSEAEGTYFHHESDDFVYSERYDDWLLQEKSAYVESISDWVLYDDTISDVNGDIILREDAQYDGETGEYYCDDDYCNLMYDRKEEAEAEAEAEALQERIEAENKKQLLLTFTQE